MTKASPDVQPGDGLIGLFGHAYTAAHDDPAAKAIQYQFEIIRKLDGQRYVVQYFSFWDGAPTNLGIYPERVLLSADVKLYATAALWKEAHDKESARRAP